MSKILCPNCGEENKVENINCIECEENLKLNYKFHLLKILGENYGTTYLAEDSLDNNKQVIIKELSLRTLDKWKTEELFKREAKVLSQLNHSLIPKYIDSFTLGIGRNAKMYLVMEKIEGENLEEERHSQYYTLKDVLTTMKKIINVLDYIHGLNPPLIHRDLKPSNLIRTKNGDIALIDFGSVRNIVKPSGGSTLIGDSGYMPPEQFTGKVSIKSDFYALGVIAVVIFSGKEPSALYQGLDFKWKEHLNLPSSVEFLLEKLLAYKEKNRISSSKEIVNMLDKLISLDNLTESQAEIFSNSYFEKTNKVDETTVKKETKPLKVFSFIAVFFTIMKIIHYIYYSSNF